MLIFVKDYEANHTEVSEERLTRTRRTLLQRLKNDVTDRRRQSLHELVKIDLRMEDQLQRVGKQRPELIPEDEPEQISVNILNRFFQRLRGHNRSEKVLESTQKIMDIFNRVDIHKKLLILGEPGAGKNY